MLRKNIQKYLNTFVEPDREERVPFGDFGKDWYEVECQFGENAHYEIGTILLMGKQAQYRLQFPFSHCYRVMDRRLSASLEKQKEEEYPLYQLKRSDWIDQVVLNAGGVWEKEELAHYQVVATHKIIDILLYKGEEVLVEQEGKSREKLG